MNLRDGTVRRFHALGDVQRLAIVELLGERSRSVTELADRLPVSRPAVSRHLRVLREAGLVSDRPIGTRRVYSLDAEAVHELAGYLDRMWDDALRRFKLVADNPPPEVRDG